MQYKLKDMNKIEYLEKRSKEKNIYKVSET